MSSPTTTPRRVSAGVTTDDRSIWASLGSVGLQEGGRPNVPELRSIPRPSRLARSITTLGGVGPKTVAHAEAIGVRTVGDLLEHVPFRHEDSTRQGKLAHLKTGEDATVIATVESVCVRSARRRHLKVVEAVVRDETGAVTAVWFNQEYLAAQLKRGVVVLLHGRLAGGRGGPTFKVKSHEIVPRSDTLQNGAKGAGRRGSAGLHTLGLVPVYPTTDGLSVKRIRELQHAARTAVVDVPDPLPAWLRTRERLPARRDALAAAHFPASLEHLPRARRRLAFEELLLHQLALALIRSGRRRHGRAESLADPGEAIDRWIDKGLPFALTGDQTQAIGEIESDLQSDEPMQRLLMGEVGSGKTVVALYAMLRASEASGQAALMAPTETLAEQHFRTVDTLTGGLEPVALLTGSTPSRSRRRTLAGLESGEIALIVGTHALLEEDVSFHRLLVAVVDEQHRFGVEQRRRLDRKGAGGLEPHVLHMTATPIPRTLALTAYGDLDTTFLKEIPTGRPPVKTWLVPEAKREAGYEFIRERLRQGRQCYVVCPLVEESDALEAKAAVAESRRLADGEFDGFSVAALHGQMPSAEKQRIMDDFSAGRLDVLVATSVIEVGIDVPNATVMVVEQAERFGLTQLHQLRGRVGRGSHESFCLLYGDPCGEIARRRLDAIVATRDGFELAEIDLVLRGEGEILGNRQHGLQDFKFASLPADEELILKARRRAAEILRADDSLSAPENALLMDAVVARFGRIDREPLTA